MWVPSSLQDKAANTETVGHLCQAVCQTQPHRGSSAYMSKKSRRQQQQTHMALAERSLTCSCVTCIPGIYIHVRGATRQRRFGRQEIARRNNIWHISHFDIRNLCYRKGHLALLCTLYFLCNMNFAARDRRCVSYPPTKEKFVSLSASHFLINSIPPKVLLLEHVRSY